MIVIIDVYTDIFYALKKSMEEVGEECKILTISPYWENYRDDVFSIYEYFIRKTEKEKLREKQLYYAFLDLPYLWEIHADGVNGAIYDRNHKKAEIYFTEPLERRNVQRVEWYNENNIVYRIDYYNKYGDKYCAEYIYDETIQTREFYNHAQQLVILEQVTEKVITLFCDGKIKKRYIGYYNFFHAYLEQLGMQDAHIVFGDEKGREQFKDSDIKVLNLSHKKIYLYNRKLEDKFPIKDVLILTGTDQVESLEEFIQTFPEIKFHIGAHTLMSDKLTKLLDYSNVSLYPGISDKKRIELYEKCSLYLDINYWEEIYDAVAMASMYSLIVFAFDTTVHHKELTLTEHIYALTEIEKMKNTIRTLLSDQMQYREKLREQRKLFDKMKINTLKRLEE